MMKKEALPTLFLTTILAKQAPRWLQIKCGRLHIKQHITVQFRISCKTVFAGRVTS